MMGTESTLSTKQQKLEAEKRATEGEKHSLKDNYDTKEKGWEAERADLNQKLQDMLAYNERVRDECLKKVVGYKEKALEYKNKVKSANVQIEKLTQHVARYEVAAAGAQ